MAKKQKVVTVKQSWSWHEYAYYGGAALFLVAATIAAYIGSLHYEFQFDDIANIQKHFQLRHYDFWSLCFTGSRWISYWINAIHYSIGKFDPFSYRVGNLIIHTINGLLVFSLFGALLRRQPIGSFCARHAYALAVGTAMLFLLHPVQTQTVSYVIQGELEGLACMAILAMIVSFVQAYYTSRAWASWVFLALMYVVALFACGTKEIAIIAPVLVVLVDWFFVARGNIRELMRHAWVHGTLFLLVVGLYMYFLKPSFFTDILGFKIAVKNNIGNIITHDPAQMITPWPFFISQFKVILHYLGMFLWPWNISVEYDWMLCSSFFAPDCIMPLMLLLAGLYGIYRGLRKNSVNPLLFGAVWFLVCIAPRSSIIPSPELLVDYKTYTASIGWLFLLAAATLYLFERLQAVCRYLQLPYARAGMTVLSSCLLIWSTVERNKIWRSGKEFWWNIIVNAPGKARAYNNYGVEIAQNEQKFAEAIPFYIKAATMDQNYPDPWNNLAVCYSQLERIDEAIEALKQGLRIHPYYPEGHNNLASFYLRKKEYDQAELYLQNALKLRPYYGKAYYNLGRLYVEQGDMAKAVEAFKNSCTIADLDNEFGFKTYAQAAFLHADYQQSIWAFEKALACNPHDHELRFSLGNAYYMAGQLADAIGVYKQVLKYTPSDPRVWFNLGEAHFNAQETDEALVCFKLIEAHMAQLPQIGVRIAGCYEKKGEYAIARAELAKLLQLPLTEEMQNKTVMLLAQLDGQYGTGA